MDASSWTIWDRLQYHRQSRPASSAIGTLQQPSLSYRALFDAARAMRATLNGEGIGASQRVALVVPDGVQMMFGMLSVGASTQALLFPINASPAEFAEALRTTRSDLAIVHRNAAHEFVPVALDLGLPVWIAEHAADAPAGAWHVAERIARRLQPNFHPSAIRIPDADDIVWIMVSSGTTGRAKLVPRTHNNIRRFAEVLINDLAITPDDVALPLTPMNLSLANQGTVMATLWQGGTAIALDGSFEPTACIALMRAFEPTNMSASPVYFRSLLAGLERMAPALQFPRMRVIRSSSDAIPNELMQAVASRFDAVVKSAYGSTETVSIAHRSSEDRDSSESDLGVVLAEAVTLLDENGEPAGEGEIGEIAIRDPAVTSGYIDDPELNAVAFRNGWFLMGDMGRFDNAGRLHYVGRKADIINRGGFKIAPPEVEKAIAAHPAVAQCGVFAVPHPSLREDIAVAVVATEGARLDLADIHQHLSGRLAQAKWPRHLFLVDELPRTAVGKVLRRELAARFEEHAVTAQTAEPALAGWDRPETAMIAGLWSYILDRPGIGADTGFIEAGGDSLQAALLQSEAMAWFSLQLDPDFILSASCTPSEIAHRL